MAVRGRRFESRDLALVAILSALGAVVSVPVGYLGEMLKGMPGLPVGTPQLLSGIHIIWLVVGRMLSGKRGTAAFIGLVKGLVEAVLFSTHGPLVLLMSLSEGVVADATLSLLEADKWWGALLAGAFSSASNVLVTYLLILPQLPLPLVGFMAGLSLISGLLAGLFCYMSYPLLASIYGS